MQENPVLVEVLRGDVIESYHRGAVAVVDGEGRYRLSLGDITADHFPRSSLKLIQVLPLLESGAADALGLSQSQLALCCSSHNGEPLHTDMVDEWLESFALEDDVLECGVVLPMRTVIAHEMLKAGSEPRRCHHMCSGKHMGMLSLCKHKGYTLHQYSDYKHPSQQDWLKVLEDLSGVQIDDMAWDYDGCGLPAVSLPLEKMALAQAQFFNPDQPKVRRLAMRRVLQAVVRHPEYLAGTNRLCTDIVKASNGNIIVKTGAEGYFVGVVPSENTGFALKIDDGATRASNAAIGGLISKMGWERFLTRSDLQQYFNPNIQNSQGRTVGQLRASTIWH